jgi:hypothetical protein
MLDNKHGRFIETLNKRKYLDDMLVRLRCEGNIEIDLKALRMEPGRLY